MTENRKERKAVPEKVTAYELALRLHRKTLEEVLSEKMASIAAENGLIICYPKFHDEDQTSLAIGFFGAKNGCCLNYSREILDGCRVIIVNFIQEIGFRIVADIPSISFLMKADDGYGGAYGLVIDMAVFDDLERAAEARRPETRSGITFPSPRL